MKETGRMLHAKTGIVLEGGAMRGMYTAGVLDVFMENGIVFDGAVGTSAGAVFGCNLKSKQIGRTIRYNKKYCRDKRYCSVRSWIRTGDLYGAEFCYHELPAVLDPFDAKTFASSPMEFWCVCTEVETAEPVYHRCTDGAYEDLEYMRGSASMPVVSRPVSIDDHLLLDGGISDSIPLKFIQRQGFSRNVVILTQPREYRKRPLKYAAAVHFFLRRYPNIWKKLKTRHEAYNEQLSYIAECEKRGEVLVIAPDEALGIGSVCHDAKELERVYRIGRTKGEQNLNKVRQFLQADT